MLIFNSKHLLIPLRHLFSHFSSNKMFWILGNKSISMLCSIFMHIKSMCECFPGTLHESSSGFTTNNVPQSKEICLPHSVGKQSLIFVSALQKGYCLNHAKLSVTFGILSMIEKLWETFASRPDSGWKSTAYIDCRQKSPARTYTGRTLSLGCISEDQRFKCPY